LLYDILADGIVVIMDTSHCQMQAHTLTVRASLIVLAQTSIAYMAFW